MPVFDADNIEISCKKYKLFELDLDDRECDIEATLRCCNESKTIILRYRYRKTN